MNPFEVMGGIVSDFFEGMADIFRPKHVNCRSAIIHPIFFDGKPRYMDIIPPETAEDYQMRKWLSQVPHGGIVGNKAVLVCYNHKHPSQSILLVEDIEL